MLGIAILLGGKSTRMGQDKALLRLPNQQVLVNFMLEKFVNYADSLVFTSGSIGQNLHSYPVVADLFQDSYGPVCGIVSCINWLHINYKMVEECYFIPVDMPYIGVSELEQLRCSSTELSYFSSHPLPLRLKINSTIVAKCQSLVNQIRANNGYSVREFITQFNYKEVAIFHDNKLRNINYYLDWEKFINEYQN